MMMIRVMMLVSLVVAAIVEIVGVTFVSLVERHFYPIAMVKRHVPPNFLEYVVPLSPT